MIQGEGRGSAIFGVVLETVLLLFFLLLLAGAIRQWLTLMTASRRWRDAPWLPGAAYPAPITGRRRGCSGPPACPCPAKAGEPRQPPLSAVTRSSVRPSNWATAIGFM